MTIRGPPEEGDISFPDNTIPIVGDQGDIVFQSNGKFLTTRTRADEAQWNFRDQDVTEDELVANPQDIGGTQYVSGGVRSNDDQTFSVKIEWQDSLGNPLYTQEPTALQNVDSTDGYEAQFGGVYVKSPRAAVRVVDESGEVTHSVTGTINFA